MVYIHRKVMFCTVINGVNFFPGINAISESELKAIEGTPAFKSEISCGNMMIGGTIASETSNAVEANDFKARASKLAKEISSMQAKEAATLVSSINDAAILKALKNSDGRKGVQEAIDSRLIEITKQVGSDLTPESKVAPEGNGADFVEKISGKKEDLIGEKSHSAIPALNKK